MYLVPDIFVLPGDGEGAFIAYAPLIGFAAHVNASMAALIHDLKRQPPGEVRVESREASAELLGLGLLSATPYPNLEPDSREQAFEPTSVSLFLTSACNLGCTYCYASANESPSSMSWPIARRAIETVFANARRVGKKHVGVVLHGGGEATLEWDLLQQIVHRTRELARDEGVSAHISIGTNGVMAPAHARWIATNLDGATVSLDGPPDVHNLHRPTVGGKPSYDVVVRTLKTFDELDFRYGLRLTVTEDWVARLPEAIEQICSLSRARQIQAEPVFPSGRAGQNRMRHPAAAGFIEAFRLATAIAERHGRHLSYSGARLGQLTDRFCEAPGRSFAVTPTGDVSSCYEVSDTKDDRMASFFWGSYENETDAFRLDEDRRKEQTQMTVHGKAGCATCFCKWSCAGDCSAKLAHLGDPRNTEVNPRCEVNRALTRDQLVRALRRGADVSSPLASAVPEEGTHAD